MFILGGFLLITDYTVQNNHIPKLDLTPEPKMEKNVIYYDKFENFGEDGIRTVTKDSIVYYDRIRNKN